ncbi:MAG TPA: metal ABC transporter substrate-binding protein, partial [Erwinia persicina]|nr:metal ABC transporter substrate-binding protein [Erwinia persicina]
MTQPDFELKKKKAWRWPAGILAMVLIGAGVGYFTFQQRHSVTFGTTLKVHYEPAMAGEQRLIDYVGQHIAPDYGIRLEAVGLQDPVQADRAVAEGQYAATVYQHQWWLKQVVEANK